MEYILTENICPSMTTEILNRLNESDVNSVLDLLLSQLPTLRVISRTKQIDFQKLLDIRSELYSRFGPKKVNAFDVFTNDIVLSELSSFQTGIENLDQMLRNGIRRGEVTELYGQSCSGKTQFCYTFMINVIQNYDKEIVYIDTDLSFSYLRLREILLNRNPILINSEIKELFSKIKVINVFDIHSLLNVFENISYKLETNVEKRSKQIGLVIIDCLSTPLSLELKKNYLMALEEKKKNNKQKTTNLRLQTLSSIKEIGNTLNCLASKHSISVVVVNSQMVNLKRNWKNCCKLCLQFEDCPNPEFKSIKITKTYNKETENSSFEGFEIFSQGFDRRRHLY